MRVPFQALLIISRNVSFLVHMCPPQPPLYPFQHPHMPYICFSRRHTCPFQKCVCLSNSHDALFSPCLPFSVPCAFPIRPSVSFSVHMCPPQPTVCPSQHPHMPFHMCPFQQFECPSNSQDALFIPRLLFLVLCSFPNHSVSFFSLYMYSSFLNHQ